MVAIRVIPQKMRTVRRKGERQKAVVCNLVSPEGEITPRHLRINPQAGMGI
jgi:hypothetical protein